MISKSHMNDAIAASIGNGLDGEPHFEGWWWLSNEIETFGVNVDAKGTIIDAPGNQVGQHLRVVSRQMLEHPGFCCVRM